MVRIRVIKTNVADEIYSWHRGEPAVFQNGVHPLVVPCRYGLGVEKISSSSSLDSVRDKETKFSAPAVCFPIRHIPVMMFPRPPPTRPTPDERVRDEAVAVRFGNRQVR